MSKLKWDKLDFPLLPVVFLACVDLEASGKFLHHRLIVTRIITGDVANLCSDHK